MRINALILFVLSRLYRQSETMQLNVPSFNLTFLFFVFLGVCTNHLISFNKHPQKSPGCHFSVLSFCPAQGRQTRENMKGHLALIVTPCLLITSVQSRHIHSEDPSQSCGWHSTIVKKQVINGGSWCLDHHSTAFKSCRDRAEAAAMFFNCFFFFF